MMPFTVGLDTFIVKKVVLHMFFLIIMQKSKLFHVILWFQKRSVKSIFIKSVFSKDQNRYYYNIFLEKFSYK